MPGRAFKMLSERARLRALQLLQITTMIESAKVIIPMHLALAVPATLRILMPRQGCLAKSG